MDKSKQANGANTVRKALKKRRSIRSFQNKPIPDAVLEEILISALDAPSWGNVQPYRVAIVQGNELRKLASELTQKFNTASKVQRGGVFAKLGALLKGNILPDGDFNTMIKYPDELRARYRETGMGLYGILDIARDDQEARHAQMARNFSFFDAPVAVFIFCEESLGAYSALDTGAFIQSLALAAEEKGLGTCIQAALATWASPVRKRFDIPKGYKLICGISIGYPTDKPVNSFAPTRRTMDDLLLSPKR